MRPKFFEKLAAFAAFLIAMVAWGQQVELSIPDVQGVPGGEVWVSIDVTIPEGIKVFSGQFTLVYDPEMLSCQEVQVSEVLEGYSQVPEGENGEDGAYFVWNADNSAGKIKLAFAGKEHLQTGSGELVKVKFRVADDCQSGSSCELGIADALFNEDIIPSIDVGTFFCSEISISGMVLDAETNQPVTEGTVEARRADGTIVSTSEINPDGSYRITGLSEGEIYDIRVYSTGYFPGWAEDKQAPSSNVNIELTPVPQVTVTNVVCDFWSTNANFRGNPIMVGDVIVAKDPDGVICGAATVIEEGAFSIHVYGDDATTADDEGAQDGDAITLYLNNMYPYTPEPKWTQNGSFDLGEVNFGGPIRDEIWLGQGWNLFSLSVQPREREVTVVLEPISGAYVYVSTFINPADPLIGSVYDSSGAKTFDINRPSFLNDLKEIDAYHGFWIKMTEERTLEVEGDPLPADVQFALGEGWNLVPYPPEEPMDLTAAFSSIQGSYIYVIGFINPSDPLVGQVYNTAGAKTWDISRPTFLNDLTRLEPDHGYWVKMSSPGTLTYSTQPNPAPRIAEGRMRPLEEIKVKPTPFFCDFWDTESEFNGRPLRPGDVITAYDSNGVLCGAAVVRHEGAYLLHVYGDDPKTPEDEGAEEGEEITFYINGEKAIATGNTAWSERGSIKLTLSAWDVKRLKPKFSALFQNYPNPFNPETWIPFQLAQDADVVIEIYDVTGSLIRKLTLGRLKAGVYKSRDRAAYWDGRDNLGQRVGSGVYFYVIKAGRFSDARKMILLK